MQHSEIDTNFNLSELMDMFIKRIKHNDYIERAIGEFGENYIDLHCNAEWQHSDSFGSNIFLKLDIKSKKDNLNFLNDLIDDEAKDNIDSGCEDEIREVINEIWGELEFEWGYAGTDIKIS